MTPDEIIAEFLKGCVDTQIRGAPACECKTCLNAAAHAYSRAAGVSEAIACRVLREACAS